MLISSPPHVCRQTLSYGARNVFLPSLGSVGDPYDNAVAESFWARMQTERLNRQRWASRSAERTKKFTLVSIGRLLRLGPSWMS
jgi:transposase InsO family protein